MTRHTRRPPLLLFACVAVAAVLLVACRGAAAASAFSAAGTEATPAMRRVEDDVGGLLEGAEEAAYPRRRALYGSGYIAYGGLEASKAVCYGSCAARGQPYTGRGCQAIYQCRG